MTAKMKLLTLLLFSAEGILPVNAFVQQKWPLAPGIAARRPFRESLFLLSKENEPSSLESFFEGLFADRPRSETEQNRLSSAADLPTGRTSLLVLQAEAVLAPAVELLDEMTDGWALSYADLTPESEETPIGRSFLATNIAYAIVGALLSFQGETLLGFMTEIVSVASFCYHYTQLQQPYMRTRDATVKLALLVDYTLAITSIMIGLVYLVTDQTLPPIEGVITCILAIACLLSCWRWEKGLPYVFWHSLWHIFSAARYVDQPCAWQKLLHCMWFPVATASPHSFVSCYRIAWIVSAYYIGNAHIMA
jgi:hypothetical protein